MDSTIWDCISAEEGLLILSTAFFQNLNTNVYLIRYQFFPCTSLLRKQKAIIKSARWLRSYKFSCIYGNEASFVSEIQLAGQVRRVQLRWWKLTASWPSVERQEEMWEKFMFRRWSSLAANVMSLEPLSSEISLALILTLWWTNNFLLFKFFSESFWEVTIMWENHTLKR